MNTRHKFKPTRPFLTLLSPFLLMVISSCTPENVIDESVEEFEYPKPGARSSLISEAAHVLYRGDSVIVLEGVPHQDTMRLETEIINIQDFKAVDIHKPGYLPRDFEVEIRSKLVTPPSRFPAVDEIFALSDIEGNFNVLTNLLQQHGVLDQDLAWKFGEGHLVVIGDVFDRGVHVTEMLWLLYKLESEAAQSGGAVHLLLGNHEAMNMRGDMRYLEPKYVTFANLVDTEHGIRFKELYDHRAELGKWLRSRNVMEQIGDQIFVHAGISTELAETGMTIEEINRRALGIMDIPKAEFDALDSLMWGKQGPYWYRGYFDVNPDRWGPKASQKDLEYILEQFGVKRVFVGHTHVERPELRYEGKVCAIDVLPPKDHLISAPPWRAYGVMVRGEQIFLADEDGRLELLEP